ncbi:MAG: fructose-bisphosphate aldolase, partial [Dyella sp.]|nr:fructose-bisphosphate aldolase [Dyella sp.]
ADSLASYAAICQESGVVPIVEPEVLMDGAHSMERCTEVTEAVLHEVFHALHRHAVKLELMLLKPSMVLPGKEAGRATPSEVAAQTVQVLKRTVPAAVPGIFFLSGGQTPTEATINLDAMNRLGPLPWRLSFSYGRALQEPPLLAWRGEAANVAQAQQALLLRSKLNAMACLGQYQPALEDGGA